MSESYDTFLNRISFRIVFRTKVIYGRQYPSLSLTALKKRRSTYVFCFFSVHSLYGFQRAKFQTPKYELNGMLQKINNFRPVAKAAVAWRIRC